MSLLSNQRRKPVFIDPLMQDESHTRYCHFGTQALIGFSTHARHYNKLQREDFKRQRPSFQEAHSLGKNKQQINK